MFYYLDRSSLNHSASYITAASDPEASGHYGPFVPGFPRVPFNDLGALERLLASDPNVAAFLVELIQVA